MAQDQTAPRTRHVNEQREPILPWPSSQPAPASRRPPGKRSPNHVPPQPADFKVISSIIASLDDLAPHGPRASHAQASPVNGTFSSIQYGSLSRASSRHAPSVPTSPLRRSVSLGVDRGPIGIVLEKREDEGDDSAEFPVVPTSRRPSVRSHHTAPTSPTSGILRSYLRTAAKSSQTSLSLDSPDHSSRGRLQRSTSILSTESWSRRSSQVSLESKPDTPIRRTPSIKRSKDQLKPETIREERIVGIAANPTPATPPRRTAPSTLTLARTSSTGKLYVENSTAEGERESLHRPYHREEQKENALPDSPTVVANIKQSPQKTTIADAIPLRTSSLYRTPSPLPKKTKTGKVDKGKRPASTSRKHSRRIVADALQRAATDMFEGLDEEDSTVKRIKELKERKETRLREESAGEQSHGMLSNLESRRTEAAPFASSRSVGPKITPQTANKTPAKTPARKPDVRKAHRVLGLAAAPKSYGADDARKPSTVASQTRQPRRQSGSPEPIRRGPLDDRNEQSPLGLTTPNPFHPVFDADPAIRQSLEYSYAAAINVLETSASCDTKGKSVNRAATKNPRLLNGLALEGMDPTPPTTSHSPRSRRRRSNSIPFEYHPQQTATETPQKDHGARPRSMNDARTDHILEEEILEERRNSVIVAVEEYLNAPRLNQKIPHPQTGRLISFSEVGDPSGAAVIVCVGMGLTRFITAFYDELATTLGLRLITIDRPGVGGSEPFPERDNAGPLNWPDDVVTVTQYLGVSQFSIIAHSAGAIYALATALILPHCIKGKVQLLAPWIPPSQFDTYGRKDNSPDAIPVGALPRSQRLLRVLPIPFLKAANGGLFSPSSLKPGSVRNSPSTSPSPRRDAARNGRNKKRQEAIGRESLIFLEQVVPEKPVNTMFPLPQLDNEEDAHNLEPVRQPSVHLGATATPTDPDFSYVAEALNAAEHSARERQSAFSAMLTEQTWTLATYASNPAVDLIVCLERYRAIGFRYVDIQRKIVITHGSEDRRVPVENVKWIGEQINRRAAMSWNPDGNEDTRERGGCEVRILPGEGHGLMASPGVMADVLTEISGEWTRMKW